MRVTQPSWSMATRGWTVDYPPECVTLRPSDDDAALQISARIKTTGLIAPDEVQGMAQRDSMRHNVDVIPASYGPFSGVAVEFSEGAFYWRRWWLANGAVLLYVTYNADAASPDRHRSDVDAILSTLELASTAVEQ